MFKLKHILLNDNPDLGGTPAPAADPTPAPAPAADPIGIISNNPTPAPAPAADPTPAPVPTPTTDPSNAVSYFADAPEDWRTLLIDQMGVEGGERTKVEQMLNRVSDIKTFAKNYVAAQDKIRSGASKDNSLPENPTPEQLSEWRTANGVPDTPEDYELKLDDGLVLGEADKSIMSEVFKTAHDLNLPAESMSKLTNSMLVARQNEAKALQAQDGVDKQQAEKILNETWGNDFNTNINMIQGLVNQLPETVRNDFISARLADGTALFSSPEVAVFFADMARKVNPAGTVVPNSNNPLQSINDEIAALEGKMGTDEWFKDVNAQKRYQELVTARSNMGNR